MVQLWQNERIMPGKGYAARHLMATDRDGWMLEGDERKVASREEAPLPAQERGEPCRWRWVDTWSVEKDVEVNRTDHEGWMYAFDFATRMTGTNSLTDCVRKRAWVRTAKRFLSPEADAAFEVLRANQEEAADRTVSDRPCSFRREGGSSLVIGGSSLVILEGKACNPL